MREKDWVEPRVPKPDTVRKDPCAGWLVFFWEDFSSFQFPSRPCNGNDLVEGLGEFLRTHRRSANENLKEAQSDSVTAMAIRSLYETFATLADDSERWNGGDAVETLDVWIRRWQPKLGEHFGDGFRPKVLRIHDEDGEARYWGNDAVWNADFEDAFAFFYSSADASLDTRQRWEIVDLGELRAERAATESEPRPYSPKG